MIVVAGDLKEGGLRSGESTIFLEKIVFSSIGSNFFVIESYKLRFEQLFGLCLKSSNPKTFFEIPILRGSNLGYPMASENR